MSISPSIETMLGTMLGEVLFASNMDDSEQCQCSDVRALSYNGKELAGEYRWSFIIACLTILSLAYDHIKTSYLKTFTAYQHLSPTARQEVSRRCLQLLSGVYIAATGYGTLAFNWSSGCDANEFFVYCLGGLWLMCCDIHALMAFPVGVTGLGLALSDGRFIEDVPWTLVLLMANVGTTWVSDFFHAVYRTSFSLEFILNFQRLYLLLSLVRVCNSLLFAQMAIEYIARGSYSGALVMVPVAMAYMYNSTMAVKFVYNMDCKKYFAGHQAHWTMEERSA